MIDEARLQGIVDEARQTLPQAGEAVERIAALIRATDSSLAIGQLEKIVRRAEGSGNPKTPDELNRLADTLQKAVTMVAPNGVYARRSTPFMRLLALVLFALGVLFSVFLHARR